MILISEELDFLITELFASSNCNGKIQPLVESICSSSVSKELLESFVEQYYFATVNGQSSSIAIRRLITSCLAAGILLGININKKETVQ